MNIPKVKPATYADLEALPPNVVGEILFGVLYAHPRPALRHGVAANVVATEITGPFQFGRGGPGGWIFATEPEIRINQHAVVPDIAGWRRERIPAHPKTAHIEVAPDWVCEVLSPSTQALDRTDKLTVYAEFGVGHSWYVDPLARTLEVFALEHGKWLRIAAFRNSDFVKAAPFEAHSFALDLLWIDEPGEGSQ